MDKKETVVINIFGAPGTGKTTLATELFSVLKKNGESCELVTEFAKEALWEGRDKVFENEIYMFAKKHHKMFVLNGQVDIIITDSPLIMTSVYNEYYGSKFKTLDKLIEEEHNKFNNINILLTNSVNFDNEGRRENELQSKEIHSLIEKHLNDLNNPVWVKYNPVRGNVNDLINVIKELSEILSKYDMQDLQDFIYEVVSMEKRC